MIAPFCGFEGLLGHGVFLSVLDDEVCESLRHGVLLFSGAPKPSHGGKRWKRQQGAEPSWAEHADCKSDLNDEANLYGEHRECFD